MDRTTFNKLLGVEISKLRHEQNMSQENFGEIVGINRTYIGAIERGEKSISAFNLYRILNAFDVNIEQFFVWYGTF